MPALIAFRALQGLGAGAVQPTAMTIIGDIYSVEERARVQGYVAGVWAASSVIGPTLGGVFVDFLSWRWIFFVNIPLGMIAAWVLMRRFHEDVTRVKHRIDIAGAVLLTAGSSLVILGLLEGGVAWAWTSPQSITVLLGGVALLVGFGFVERHAAEPILPGWVLRHRLISTTSLASLGVGAVLIGLTSYVPLYVQRVLGTGALTAGFALAALTIGWPISATLAGRIYLRIGFRATALIGAAVSLVGTGMLLLISAESSRLPGRLHLLRHRPRHGARREPDADRRPVVRRVERPRRRHRDEHVRPVDGQRARDRRLRRHRQRVGRGADG